MKRLRPVYIENAKTVSDSETVTVDIKGSDPISALEILYQATNGATSSQEHFIHDDVDNITLEDGSDTLFNLTGIETQAMNFYEMNKLPPRTLTEAAAGVQKSRFFIHFGRFLGDEEYHLTPNRFDNLDLKLEHSLAISATAGFATGTGRLTVIAHTFVDPPTPARGFMMSKRIDSFTSAASGTTKTKLPSDYPIRMALFRAFETGIGMHENISNVKISCDNDKYIPINHPTAYLQNLAEYKHGLADVNIDLLRTDADTIASMLAVVKEANVNAYNDLDLASLDAINDDILTLQLLSLTVVPAVAKSGTDTQVYLAAKGLCPFNTVPILPQDYHDPAAWFDASQWDEVIAEWTHANAGAACSVLAQQPRTF